MNDDIDWSLVEDAALALLYLTLHDRNRVWKQIDWNVTNLLWQEGLIFDPRNKTKSLELTEDGLARAESMYRKMFVPTSRSE